MWRGYVENIYCDIAGQKVSRCLVQIGQVDPKISSKRCSECEYHKKSKWLQEVKRHRQKEAEEDRKNKDALEKDIIRLSLGPLPAVKKSKAKLPKEKKVKDAHTGKWRRLRFDVDYWKRKSFHDRLESLAQHLSEKSGRQKEGPPRSEVGKQLVLNMSIQELVKQPEMKGFKSSNERTLKTWRYDIYKMWLKENPALKVFVGRPKRIKLP